jgi:hypothetical protein
MKLTFPIVLLLLALASPAAAGQLQTVSKTFSTESAANIEVGFPAGDLTITAGDGSEVAVDMTARCGHDYGTCAEQAREVRLTSEKRGGTLHFKLEGLRKVNSHGLSIDLRMRVPRSLALSVEMGAGDLEVRGMEGDVEVHLGAGHVDIRAPERAVHSVKLAVGVGDATMLRQRERHEGSGFISKTLRWRGGAGPAGVQVDVGVGDVDVRLE